VDEFKCLTKPTGGDIYIVQGIEKRDSFYASQPNLLRRCRVDSNMVLTQTGKSLRRKGHEKEN
jgi:hypothetical protein